MPDVQLVLTPHRRNILDALGVTVIECDACGNVVGFTPENPDPVFCLDCFNANDKVGSEEAA